MKKISVKFLALAVVCFLSIGLSHAEVKEIKIKTSAQCEMCKEKIEKAMAYEKGIKTFSLDLETKVLTVTYDDKKTNPDKIREAIAKLGYDADDVPGNPKAYAKLPACCKKPTPEIKQQKCNHGEHEHSEGHTH